MTLPSVHACLTTRDGAIRNDVMACLISATQQASAAGVSITAGRQQFNHGTAVCRNKSVADFLAHTKADYLLFVDDDVMLERTNIVHLMESAAGDRPIVCGAYPTFKFAGNKAYLYLTARPVGGDWLNDYADGIIEIDAGGTGCMAIRRDVFAAVGFPWFRWPEEWNQATGTVEWVSDDVDFCAAARAKGFSAHCDGRVRPGHLKLTDLKTLMDGSLRWRESLPPADDGYGSHAGALRAVAKLRPVRSVVEYGCGRFSTPLFLDKGAFPDLESLVSVESNPDWVDDIRRLCGADERLTLKLCPLEAMPAYTHPAADLVFIDCDEVKGGHHDYSIRLRLIERYATDPHTIIVVHDANFAAIRPALQASGYRYKATHVPSFGPHTALLSNAVHFTGPQ